MILDLIKYFARYPSKAGVLKIFVRGESALPEYASLLNYIKTLPEQSLMPEIENYVVASSLDKVKGYVSNFRGVKTFLMLDYGEISSVPDSRDSMQDNMGLAITVACHLDNNADLVEDNIASDITLAIANRLRAQVMVDSRNQALGHGIKDIIAGAHKIMPFESKELQSVGWTIAFSMNATDLLDVSRLRIIYQNK